MFNQLKQKTAKFLDDHTRRLFDVDDGKLKHVPNPVIWLIYLMCLNVLFQGIADLIIKFLGYTPILPTIPWRMDFLFLTAISVLMGYQALIGMRRREIDVTRNSIQIGLLVEVGLIIGDIYFLWVNPQLPFSVTIIRAPFVILTLMNVFILLYVSKRLRIFRDQTGNWKLF